MEEKSGKATERIIYDPIYSHTGGKGAYYTEQNFYREKKEQHHHRGETDYYGEGGQVELQNIENKFSLKNPETVIINIRTQSQPPSRAKQFSDTEEMNTFGNPPMPVLHHANQTHPSPHHIVGINMAQNTNTNRAGTMGRVKTASSGVDSPTFDNRALILSSGEGVKQSSRHYNIGAEEMRTKEMNVENYSKSSPPNPAAMNLSSSGDPVPPKPQMGDILREDLLPLIQPPNNTGNYIKGEGVGVSAIEEYDYSRTKHQSNETNLSYPDDDPSGALFEFDIQRIPLTTKQKVELEAQTTNSNSVGSGDHSLIGQGVATAHSKYKKHVVPYPSAYLSERSGKRLPVHYPDELRAENRGERTKPAFIGSSREHNDNFIRKLASRKFFNRKIQTQKKEEKTERSSEPKRRGMEYILSKDMRFKTPGRAQSTMTGNYNRSPSPQDYSSKSHIVAKTYSYNRTNPESRLSNIRSQLSPGLEKNSNKDKVFVDDLESIGILLTSAKNMRIDYLKHKQSDSHQLLLKRFLSLCEDNKRLKMDNYKLKADISTMIANRGDSTITSELKQELITSYERKIMESERENRLLRKRIKHISESATLVVKKQGEKINELTQHISLAYQ